MRNSGTPACSSFRLASEVRSVIQGFSVPTEHFFTTPPLADSSTTQILRLTSESISKRRRARVSLRTFNFLRKFSGVGGIAASNGAQVSLSLLGVPGNMHPTLLETLGAGSKISVALANGQSFMLNANLNGGRIVAAGGLNLVAAGGMNLVAAGGGNLVAAGGMNLVAAGGGNITSDGLASLISCNDLVAAGGGNIIAAGGEISSPPVG